MACPFNAWPFATSCPRSSGEIQAAGLSRFWLAEEYLGRIELLAMLAGPPLGYLLWKALGLPGMIVTRGPVATLGYLLRRQLCAVHSIGCKPSNAACRSCLICSRC